VVCEISIASAAPRIPSAGSGPGPKISSGLRAMSRPTDTNMKMNGVRASPPPRKTIAA
jgi:hypothetical protein